MEKVQILLEWCQSLTMGYRGVRVENFTTSWKNGLAFAALIHRFKPELIDFYRLNPNNEMYNNNMAFKIAEIHFGIPSLLDAKYMALTPCPEMLSIITYVSQFYNCLKNMEPSGGPDINKFENINKDFTDHNIFSSQTSVEKLKEMKCSICFTKVFLLERYVAEDQLYHRQCYRDFQIKNIDNDSEVIGDYLNIYGELKPTMNRNIFVHPLLGMKPDDVVKGKVSDDVDEDNVSDDVVEDIVSDDVFKGDVSDPHDSISEDLQNVSEISDSEEYSESLSSFNSEKYCTGKLQYEDDVCHQIIKDEVISDQSVKEDSSNTQENFVHNIAERSILKPIKTRLYIKKKDSQLPYSTFFEVSNNISYKICSNFNDVNNEQSVKEDNAEIKHLPIDENSVNFKNIDVKHDDECRNERKLLEIKIETDSETDLSSVEEDFQEVVEPSIVRNCIWRKPIICSTSLRKCQSVTVPIETKYKCYAEFKERLESLNMKQSQIESKGRKIQLRLWEEDPSSSDYENLLCTWLELVEEKDKIFYEENSIYSWLKDIKLQEMKEKLECQIRLLGQGKNESESVRNIEEELIKKLIETVNQRSELVDAMDKENLKRLETKKMRHETVERLCPLNDKKVEPNCVEPIKSREIPKKKPSFWNRKSSHI